MPASARLPPPAANRLRPLLWTVVCAAFVLVVHNFGLSVLPSVAIPLPPASLRAEFGGHAVSIAFDHSPGDTMLNPRSRVTLTENARPLILKLRKPDAVFLEGRGAWSHVPGRIIFSATDGSDPRTNGLAYVAHSPILYSRGAGYSALVALVAALMLLRRRAPALPPPSAELTPPNAPSSRAFGWHLAGASLVFFASLYFATGTLAPYANTLLQPHVDPATGYLYNLDHSLHRTLFALVDGQPRELWQDSLLLRRVLYGVLAWPWMQGFGYELGGVLCNLFANLLGFAAGVALVHRHIGRRGAILAAWLLALYPGAAYWVGQPYSYALIFPLGIAAFWLLLELPTARTARVATLSLALGVIYLSYDFHAYFLPASLLLLLWHRRWVALPLSAALQVLPLALWLWTLKSGLQVPLENSNTAVYRELLASFFDPTALTANLARLAALPETAADVFFGSNFLFLPLLAAAAWALDFSWKEFTRHRAVPALLVAGAALFAFCNLPPPHEGPWNLSGSWIARLYQPLFPALVFSVAGWWQERSPRSGWPRRIRIALVGVALLGNGLICFGPAAAVTGRVAETAFSRFYDHNDLHWAHERNLRVFGRRPLGFPRSIAPAVTKP